MMEVAPKQAEHLAALYEKSPALGKINALILRLGGEMIPPRSRNTLLPLRYPRGLDYSEEEAPNPHGSAPEGP